MAKKPIKKISKAAVATAKKKEWPKCSVVPGCTKGSIMFRRLFDGTEIHTCSLPDHQAAFNKQASDSKPKAKIKKASASDVPPKKITKRVAIKKPATK